jgi:hypothetical protein
LKRRLPKLVAALATSWLLSSAPARAQVTSEPTAAIFPDPAKFAHGLYTEGEVGALVFIGKVSEDVAPGFAIGARFGYDVFRFFAVQAHFIGSTHETKADSVVAGQLLQTYQGTVEGKLTYRFTQASIFAEGGLGAARMSSHLLYALGLTRPPGYRTGFTAGGGAGADYHSLSRHFSVGARADFYWLKELVGTSDLTITAYLRYTF